MRGQDSASASIFQNAQVWLHLRAERIVSHRGIGDLSGNRLTIQRAETTIYSPDGQVYHTYVHQDLGVQLETLVRPYSPR
ncbi:MAG: hypothetical protein U0P30_13475 [Vicinamibacterales bacterium]